LDPADVTTITGYVVADNIVRATAADKGIRCPSFVARSN